MPIDIADLERMERSLRAELEGVRRVQQQLDHVQAMIAEARAVNPGDADPRDRPSLHMDRRAAADAAYQYLAALGRSASRSPLFEVANAAGFDYANPNSFSSAVLRRDERFESLRRGQWSLVEWRIADENINRAIPLIGEGERQDDPQALEQEEAAAYEFNR